MPIGATDGPSTRAGGAGLPGSARNLDAGLLLIALGAIMLFVSLFLEWYQPNAEAWDVFEVWDLVLALLAIAALVAAASRLGVGTPRPASWLIGASAAALLIVLYALIDPPPVADAIGDAGGGFGDPGTGLWLALAATILMAIGTLLSVARISVAINTHGSGLGDRHGHGAGVGGDPHRADPVVAHPERAGESGLGARMGARLQRSPPSAEPEPIDPGGPATEPTRRI